jgi:glycosyltransferase XagB
LWGDERQSSHGEAVLSVAYEVNPENGPRLRGELAFDKSISDLPVVPPELLDQIVARSSPKEVELALRHQIVPIAWLPDRSIFAAVEGTSLQRAKDLDFRPVAQIKLRDFKASIRRCRGPELLHRATHYLSENKPELSAHRRLTLGQIIVTGVGAFIYIALLVLTPFDISFAITSLMFTLFFLSVTALRLMCVIDVQKSKPCPHRKLSFEDLPVYSVLVPLFRETRILGQLLSALTQLDYPTHKLDIKLILEENDIAMHRAVAALGLPEHFDLIIVPVGKPQTKPRALNYALQFARGEFLTIYDAEDMPEPDQLRKAAEAFAAGPENLACLQAELTFYNANENWLTRQFAVEYSVLFGLVLPCLAKHNLPMPLGGTSNHFRTKLLIDVGAWDPFNVTEDADLGLRFARQNYCVQMLDSKTYEEANVQLNNWIYQRARWFKGFLQTWLVHMRSPKVLQKQIGWDGLWTVNATIFGTVFSSFVHPIFTLLLAYQLRNEFVESSIRSNLVTGLLGLSLAVITLSYATALYAGYLVTKKNKFVHWSTLMTMPCYWLLMGFSAWLSVKQFIFQPFHWNKTKHGLSKLSVIENPYLVLVTEMMAGPKITTKITGRKKRIIGTVNFGGRAAAFLSASAMRSLRFSWARTRKAEAKGVPYFSD